eukprot:CAMPEP_0181329900 /NCGR_PEP_ID=MMETSP1101-20121128/23582_1 /TAXON_ID=46948 /ORGANISM="Rhodomonas abbreviata, Strain Caron Lab Isolate" /LENGTH=86 /DNA_ID=CAMNT_0023439059 /DNA_START=80 /DNA_END=337 /DNA_ORIENTATION=+
MSDLPFFDGKAVSSRGAKKKGGKEDKSEFIARTQAQRQARQASKQQLDAAAKLQAFFRKCRTMRSTRAEAARTVEAAVKESRGKSW